MFGVLLMFQIIQVINGFLNLSMKVYLLKSKFEVSTFPIFDKLISTQFGVKIQIA